MSSVSAHSRPARAHTHTPQDSFSLLAGKRVTHRFVLLMVLHGCLLQCSFDISASICCCSMNTSAPLSEIYEHSTTPLYFVFENIYLKMNTYIPRYIYLFLMKKHDKGCAVISAIGDGTEPPKRNGKKKMHFCKIRTTKSEYRSWQESPLELSNLFRCP